jgi:hypothetical protein
LLFLLFLLFSVLFFLWNCVFPATNFIIVHPTLIILNNLRCFAVQGISIKYEINHFECRLRRVFCPADGGLRFICLLMVTAAVHTGFSRTLLLNKVY